MSNVDDRNLDDELLSAYLDEELAPEERARVEARLAADPAARQLLEELRTVSRAVKALPHEALPGDLSESVLRRAERAMLTSDAPAAGESAAAGGLVELARRIPIGRSRRAWVWAGTAIAAGLLIMVFERGRNQNADMPGEVAHGDVAEVRRPLPRLEMRALEEEPASVAVDGNTFVGGAALEPRERLSTSAPTGEPAVESSRTESVERHVEGTPSADHFAFGGAGGAVTDTLSASESGKDKSPAPADGVDLLVVHVNARPEAIQQQLIDGVLARNGIVVEQPGTVATGEIAAGELAGAESRASESDRDSNVEELGRRDSAKLATASQPMDVVLVEADAAQIASCLSDIDADSTNYLGIEVDDALTQGKFAAGKSQFDWKQHNRGVMPQQQKVQLADDREFYLETNGRQVLLGREALDQREPENSQNELAKNSAVAQSRAVRFQPQAEGKSNLEASGPEQPSARGGAIAPYGVESLDFARRGMQKLAAKSNMLQVLFVLSAGEEPAAPAAPAASTASPPPAEEGLNNDE